MRQIGQLTLNHLAQNGGIEARILVWIAARDTVTGATVEKAYWTGDEARAVTIGNRTPTFEAVGDALQLEPPEYTGGIDARRHQLHLAGLPGDIETVLRGLDVRLAPIEVWRLLLAPEQQVDAPHRLLKGWIDDVDIATGAEGQSGSITMTVASSAMALTRTLERRWSDATQQRRSVNDRIFKYTSVSGEVPIQWA